MIFLLNCANYVSSLLEKMRKRQERRKKWQRYYWLFFVFLFLPALIFSFFFFSSLITSYNNPPSFLAELKAQALQREELNKLQTLVNLQGQQIPTTPPPSPASVSPQATAKADSGSLFETSSPPPSFILALPSLSRIAGIPQSADKKDAQQHTSSHHDRSAAFFSFHTKPKKLILAIKMAAYRFMETLAYCMFSLSLPSSDCHFY